MGFLEHWDYGTRGFPKSRTWFGHAQLEKGIPAEGEGTEVEKGEWVGYKHRKSRVWFRVCMGGEGESFVPAIRGSRLLSAGRFLLLYDDSTIHQRFSFNGKKNSSLKSVKVSSSREAYSPRISGWTGA
jgi:hypothetical protein